MKLKHILIFAFTISLGLHGETLKSKPVSPAAVTPAQSACLTAEEKKLVDQMNSYRRSKGLSILMATKSMSYVAKVHAADLSRSRPSGQCNMHSWSSAGPWSPCCYTRDHAKSSCMWKKPQELSPYRGNGFEISSGSSGSTIDAATALRLWQGSSGHNAVIVNQGMWNRPWKAFGVGINNGYAVAWFGNETDPLGEAAICK